MSRTEVLVLKVSINLLVDLPQDIFQLLPQPRKVRGLDQVSFKVPARVDTLWHYIACHVSRDDGDNEGADGAFDWALTTRCKPC